MRFDLHSPSLAQYHWGTLFCRFSAAAPVEKETFVETLASHVATTASWTTDAEFRAAVAFLHEIAHLAQDLTTGLGHCDYLTHRTTTSSLLHYSSIVVGMDGAAARPPYRQPNAPPWFEKDSFVSKAHEQLRYYPFAMIPPERLERIRALLQEELKRPVDDESLFDLSTQSLLECDAASSVVSGLRSLRMTDEQEDIVVRNRDVFDMESLGPEYWKAFGHLQAMLRHYAALDERQAELLTPRVFDLFVDSALACPPADWLTQRGEAADDYEPGVKYVRLLVAFQKLVGATMEQFWRALAANREMEAETIVLAHASFPYPSSERIYEAWSDALTPWLSKSIVAEIRHATCRYRLDHGVLQTRRSLELLCNMQAPILYLHKDHGFVKHDWGERVLDREKDFGLMQELVDEFMVMELADFLFRTGEFRCPHAQADICSAVEDGCTSGIVHLAQFPESRKCFARALLSHCGVPLPAG